MIIYTKIKHNRTKVNYRKIWSYYNGPIPKDATGRSFDIHHVDGNQHNNQPDNLIAVSVTDHYQIHYQQQDWAACLLIAKRMKLSFRITSMLASLQQQERVRNGTHTFLRRADGSSVARESNLKKARLGIHQWQRRADGSSFTGDLTKAGKNPFSRRKDGSSSTGDRTKAGLNPLSRRKDGSSTTGDRTALGLNPFSRRKDGTSVASDKVKNGTHNWLKAENGESDSSRKVKAGTHHLLKQADGSSVASKSVEKGIHPKFIKVSCVYCHTEASITNFRRWHGNNCKHKTQEKGT